MPEQIIITPGGARHASLVHRIDPGHIIDGTAGRLRHFDQASKLVADYGPLAERPRNLALMPANVVLPPLRVPALQEGWISYASWLNNTGHPIALFRATWVVPPPPATQSGQLLYLFNGIQNSTMIYQPVLQWGSNGAFGGDYWLVASWYADGQNGQAFYSQNVKVNPGDTLVGVMALTQQSGGQFSYSCEFQGLAATSLTIANQQELVWSAITLEAYHLTQCLDYPNVDFTAFTAIDIQTAAGAAAVTWTASPQ